MIEQESGLLNVILDGNTVILDFVDENGKHYKKYHRYKTREKALKYHYIYGKGHNKFELSDKMFDNTML